MARARFWAVCRVHCRNVSFPYAVVPYSGTIYLAVLLLSGAARAMPPSSQYQAHTLTHSRRSQHAGRGGGSGDQYVSRGTGFASIGLRGVFCKNLRSPKFLPKRASESVHASTKCNCSEKITTKFENKLAGHKWVLMQSWADVIFYAPLLVTETFLNHF